MNPLGLARHRSEQPPLLTVHLLLPVGDKQTDRAKLVVALDKIPNTDIQ